MDICWYCLLSISIPFFQLLHQHFHLGNQPSLLSPSLWTSYGAGLTVPYSRDEHTKQVVQAGRPSSMFHSLTIIMGTCDQVKLVSLNSGSFMRTTERRSSLFTGFKESVSGSTSSNFVSMRGKICQRTKLIQIEAEMKIDSWCCDLNPRIQLCLKLDYFMNLVFWANFHAEISLS